MTIEFHQETIFQINKLTGTIPDIDNSKLATEILTIKSDPISKDATSTSYEDTLLQHPEGSEAAKLIEKITEIAESLGHCYDGAWFQVHHKYESTNQHVHYDKHKDIALSWCYYVAADENSGDLVFMLDSTGSEFLGALHKPVPGTFVIFPSFVEHKVNKNLSDTLRICVAGNFIPFGGRGAYR